MQWKNFFYFSKGQRRGITVLLVLIILVFVATIFIFRSLQSEILPDDYFLAEAKEFQQSLQSKDSIRQAEWQRQYAERKQTRSRTQQVSTKNSEEENGYILFTFDPNTADSLDFIRLGLKSYIVSNILKYRQRGGKFLSSNDFSKIYGITPEKAEELESYINIPKDTALPVINDKFETTVGKIVDLNRADTTELMQIRGIGRSYARSIVRFRDESGGFVSVEQLQDIYRMTPENYERIKPFCNVDPFPIEKINVNTAGVERLRKHPYINFYQAKELYELRRKKGKLKSMDDLKNLKEWDEETRSKTSPYLSFE